MESLSVEEVVTLTCEGLDETAFRSAILQLGYEIIDDSWDDEADVMTFQVRKKWLKQTAS